MDSSKYTYSKAHAFIWTGFWLLVLITSLIRLATNHSKPDWWLIVFILIAVVNIIVSTIRYLLPALNAKVAIEVTDEYIVSGDESIPFTAINHFVLYDSGVIAVILNEAHERPKNVLKWLDYWLTKLFYRSSVIIDTRDVKVKAPALFNSLVDRLENTPFNAAL